MEGMACNLLIVPQCAGGGAAGWRTSHPEAYNYEPECKMLKAARARIVKTLRGTRVDFLLGLTPQL